MTISPDIKCHFVPKPPLPSTQISETPKTKHEFLKRKKENIASHNPVNTPAKLFAFLKNDAKYINTENMSSWHPGKRYSHDVQIGEW